MVLVDKPVDQLQYAENSPGRPASPNRSSFDLGKDVVMLGVKKKLTSNDLKFKLPPRLLTLVQRRSMASSRLHCSMVIRAVMTLAFALLPIIGRGEYPSPPPGCPPLPEQGAGNKVSIHVIEALDTPRMVCVRAINGLQEMIGIGGVVFRLQKWEKRWWRGGQFRDFKETPPSGTLLGATAVLTGMSPGGVFDARLPHFSPAPPGKYRVCFRYQLQAPRHGEPREVCSEEFSLP
jgi:hypothetical protein